MPKKKADEPKPSLAQMIDQRLALKEQIEKLEEEASQLGDEIAKIMTRKNLKFAFGNSGDGYRKSSWLQADFKPDALEYVRRIKKEHLFVPEPLITKARLRDAFSAGHLTAVQVGKIQKFAGPDYRVHRLYKISKDEGSTNV